MNKWMMNDQWWIMMMNDDGMNIWIMNNEWW